MVTEAVRWSSQRLATGVVLASIIVLGASLLMAACGGETFGGLSAEEAFADKRISELIGAVLQEDYERADRLIAVGVEVNARGAKGVSPLLWVLGRKDLKGGEYLLKAGADANAKMDNGHSAMSLGAGGDDHKVLALLLRYGGDPNLKGPDGVPLLNIAALSQRTEQLRILVEAGADVNYHSHGETAGDVAAAVGRFDLVAYLLEHGLTYGLEHLYRGVGIRQVPPGSEQEKWKNKVVETLRARGVAL